MNSVVRKKKYTLFGKIVRKVESELSSQQDKPFSVEVLLNDTRVNDADVDAIQSRRDELKSAQLDNSDVVVTFNGEK